MEVLNAKYHKLESEDRCLILGHDSLDRINRLMNDVISIRSLELPDTVKSCESKTNKTNVLPAGITSVKLNNK